MTAKIIGVVLITGVFAVLGEFIIRRNRRDRAERARLATDGVRVQGRVANLTRVAAGKYGSYKLRAEIEFEMAGVAHTHVAAWWPHEAQHVSPDAAVDLLVDPTDPATACVAGNAAPDLERDSVWRWLTVGVAVVAVALALVS